MVDQSKYKKLFLDETADNIAAINDALPLLGEELKEGEESPVQVLFRSFHSIKGMASSMNYRVVQEVAHKLEDLLEEVRKGNVRIEENTRDILFEGASILERLVDCIAADSDELVETASFLKRLLALSSMTPALDEASSLSSLQIKKPTVEELPQTDLADLSKAGKQKYKITVTISKESISPPARAYLIIESLKQKSEISKTIPTIEEISVGNIDHEFTAFVATESPADEIKAIIDASVEVEKYEMEAIKVALGAREGEPEKLRVRTPDEGGEVPVLRYRKPGAVKVESFTIDALLNIVGEMFIRQNQLRDITKSFNSREGTESVNQLEKLVRKLYKEMMTLRLVPISMLSDMIPRIIREVLKNSDKKTELVVKGKEINLDRTIIEKLGDPLIHLIRNCLDHGIETPDERIKAGKPEVSKLTFEASRIRDTIIIELSDDGRGLDVAKIKEKVIAKGFATKEHLDLLEESEIHRYIFMPGLSTTEKVSSVSGRGVGMDIVKNAVEELGGKISITSTLGQGCCFRLQIPMSIAIIKTLRIKLNDDLYAVPVGKIVHTIEVQRESIQEDGMGAHIYYREERIPVRNLKSILRYEAGGESSGNALSLLVVDAGEADNGKTALVVDSLLSIYDTVIKSLSNPLKKLEVFSGITISEKGDLILILDVDKLFTPRKPYGEPLKASLSP